MRTILERGRERVAGTRAPRAPSNNNNANNTTHRVGRAGGELGAKVVGRAEVVGVVADGFGFEHRLRGEGGRAFRLVGRLLGSCECAFFCERACACVRAHDLFAP